MGATVKELEDFFFRCALAAYVERKVPKTTIPELPGSKVYRIQEGNLLYLDTYFTNGEYSGGQTVIFEHRLAVWMMHYHGWCKDDNKQVLNFLKRALLANYQNSAFVGGRGPRHYAEQPDDPASTLEYTNIGDPYNHQFVRFKGKEWIINSNEDVIFWHDYSGMLCKSVDSRTQFWLPPARL